MLLFWRDYFSAPAGLPEVPQLATHGAGHQQTWHCVQVRPLNQRELNEGHRVCTHFDEETGQVALTVTHILLPQRARALELYFLP